MPKNIQDSKSATITTQLPDNTQSQYPTWFAALLELERFNDSFRNTFNVGPSHTELLSIELAVLEDHREGGWV